MAQPARARDEPALVVAHRGLWNPAPQNSIAAFQQAIDDGVDGVELDVRRTGDGRLIVIHDPRLGIRSIAHLNHAEVQRRVAEGQAPTLAEVLAALAGRVMVDVELKENRYVSEAVTLITQVLPPEGFVVTSFHDAVLRQVRAAAPQIRTGLLLGPRQAPGRLAARVKRTGVDFLAPHVALTRGGLIDWAVQRGLPVWVWTVNDPGMRRALLFDPRVEAVITDHALDAVREAGVGPPPSASGRRRPAGPGPR
jgi:glycerophosphoryl diester phosphodiesterase